MLKHTPGPWAVNSEHLTVLAEDSGYVCKVAGPGPNDPESLANAHLIAAAPELLAAAELALTAVADPADWNFKARPALMAAIAKAKGGAK